MSKSERTVEDRLMEFIYKYMMFREGLPSEGNLVVGLKQIILKDFVERLKKEKYDFNIYEAYMVKTIDRIYQECVKEGSNG